MERIDFSLLGVDIARFIISEAPVPNRRTAAIVGAGTFGGDSIASVSSVEARFFPQMTDLSPAQRASLVRQFPDHLPTLTEPEWRKSGHLFTGKPRGDR